MGWTWDARRLQWDEDERNDTLVVNSLADLPAPVDGVITLPANTTVELSGAVDITPNRLVASAGTGVIGRDPGRDGLITANAGAAITFDGIGQVICRNLYVVNVAGSAFDVTADDEHVNFFYVGVLGSAFGTFTGGRVVALKSCYLGPLVVPGVGTFAPTGGAVFAGTTNKVFVSDTPFEDLAGSVVAVTLAADLDADVVDIRGNYFKGTGGTATEVEAGASVREGTYLGNTITGAVTPVTGFSGADVNWSFSDNSGARNSQVLGMMSISTEAVTNIVTVDTPVKVAGSTTPAALNERFSHSNNRLTYTGLRPVDVEVIATAYLASASNNKEYRLWIASNGTPIDEGRAIARVSAGADRRQVTVAALAQMATDDYLELWVECLTDDTDVTVEDFVFAVKA